MYKLIRPLIFKASSDPETMHRAMMRLLHMVGNTAPLSYVERAIFNFSDERLCQNIFGLKFKNPVGLAGGFDKHAEAVEGFVNMGFGFLEIGTVTKLAQPGNPRPRIIRYPLQEALINRMGFNNEGADFLANKLSQAKKVNIPFGINLGKSKVTELKDAAEDYLYSFSKLYNYGDYFVVNVSSPNTPGLRQLQDKSFLVEIIKGLRDFREKQNLSKPIFIKISPELSFNAVDEVLEVIKENSVDGIIAINSSLGREYFAKDPDELGGVSGRPLTLKSTRYIQHIHKQFPSLPIIGVGGIFSALDAYEKIKAGASLVQIYTGLIFEGPGLVRNINRGLVKLLERDGFKNISEAVGVENK